jgi:hypothetical protein
VDANAKLEPMSVTVRMAKITVLKFLNITKFLLGRFGLSVGGIEEHVPLVTTLIRS